MIIAATKPTTPASPNDCTKPIMFEAISPTNGTFPPSKLTTIPRASSDITTFVRLSKIDVSPDIAFMITPFFLFTISETNHFALSYSILTFYMLKKRLKYHNLNKRLIIDNNVDYL